jgi:hypothetical protein
MAVSDHALIRWLERVHNIDMEGYRAHLEEIVAPAVEAKVDGWWYVFSNGVLRTVVRTKPSNRSKPVHDNGNVNGTHIRERQHWKDKARKRRWR